eukprot:CAMPEP_0198284734 /NCGR_PEP_ID=MMETSP1449-20131203/4188_1 /TAXON_ID=420275 /ORGANISM="Attheya septentrionalis, Strain CCMP2084" /LENGTH=153 /DNA_ID=CAMNT_0043981947 /DNA_START=168 /DNA_END=629 /DNA_ORIENTATION=+
MRNDILCISKSGPPFDDDLIEGVGRSMSKTEFEEIYDRVLRCDTTEPPIEVDTDELKSFPFQSVEEEACTEALLRLGVFRLFRIDFDVFGLFDTLRLRLPNLSCLLRIISSVRIKIAVLESTAPNCSAASREFLENFRDTYRMRSSLEIFWSR